MCRKPAAARSEGLAERAEHEVGEKIHMDLTSDTGHLPVREIVMRGALFFGYLIGFMAVMAVIGLIPTVALFVVFFMRYEATGALVAGHPLCQRPGALHLVRLRLVHGGALAADAARRLVPGDEGNSLGVSPSCTDAVSGADRSCR